MAIAATTTQLTTAPIMSLTTAQPASLATANTTTVPTIPQTTATTYSPNTINVSPQSTVSGQLDTLLKSGSPIMQTAETQATQAANSRGLMNSSMAVQAGRQAVINSAMPIAQQDASTNFTAQRANQDATNTAGQFNTGQVNDIAKTNTANTIQASEFNTEQSNANARFNAEQSNSALSQSLDQAFKSQLATADAATRVQLEQMQNDTSKALANIQADYQTLMQTSSSAASLYGSTMSQVADIVKDTNMDGTAKATAINGVFARLSTAMNLIGSINGVDLSGLLDFGTVTADAGTEAP